MKKERITTVSSDELNKMKDWSREDASEGPSLPKDFGKTGKVTYPMSQKEAVKVRYNRDM